MIQLLSGDCRDVLATLPAESVQCCITSPPYYGLRDYGTALWDGGDAACDHGRPIRPQRDNSGGLVNNRLDTRGSQAWSDATSKAQYANTCGKCGAVRVDRQIGLERDPSEYLATMVGVFREIRRVLRRDGTCWVNMGDSYARRGGMESGGPKQRTNAGSLMPAKVLPEATKEKDLLLMPARLALALQADGWWVRSDIIWHKPNPMPESCTDRPTSAHEHVFLLTRSARYYYDADAVREEAEYGYQHNRSGWVSGGSNGDGHRSGGCGNAERNPASGRNLRNVWTIATHAYSAAHFATFPPELAERCIKAGTSERGCCAACGKPWQRVTETAFVKLADRRSTRKAVQDGANMSDINSHNVMGYNEVTTTGWSPGCDHGADVVPCTVLDPFIGAGTTALVADRLQRDVIGIDLNTQYTRMAMDRCIADAPLFTAFPPAEPPEDERMADLFTDMAAD